VPLPRRRIGRAALWAPVPRGAEAGEGRAPVDPKRRSAGAAPGRRLHPPTSGTLARGPEAMAPTSGTYRAGGSRPISPGKATGAIAPGR
jgi:hypothetical protein